ncbi:MAG: pyrroline-5-carboxylate reductase [Kordiimonadales bacterium]|nr:MAG: pyrroline-5-carboxylate reductase [Kordiimonadales bacterium]
MHDQFSLASPLVLVGCGHMGRALAEGWLKAGLLPAALVVVDPAVSFGSLSGVPAENFYGAPKGLPNKLKARVVVLAVKPQIIAGVLTGLKAIVQTGTLVVSVAGGITLETLVEGFGEEPDYVRAMPNTPAAVGAGITGLVAHRGIHDGNKTLASDLFAAVGSAVWVPAENHMNTVTAVSGSGPAYVFHLVECMAAAGVREGLTEETASALARQTIIGAAKLLEADVETSASTFRERVTSPAGTTAAALEVLMQENGLQVLMRHAIRAARKRGEELAG